MTCDVVSGVVYRKAAFVSFYLLGDFNLASSFHFVLPMSLIVRFELHSMEET
ncbi:hypothetical protein BDW42DRAFT_181780 [Aspergillus taichungensis]|uniref:Uncharacterized protein n=1 Tax=Aspergillus taichungensis TaxID=482145 RepID=A0A2J5HDA2_9EURO|nr:hypothetical protein BDW42DRAFT_181780 [Aspergillus taichungensis]